MARGVEDLAPAVGYSVVPCNCGNDHEKETQYIDITTARTWTAAARGYSDLTRLIHHNRPTVTLGSVLHGFEIDGLMLHNLAGVFAATCVFPE